MREEDEGAGEVWEEREEAGEEAAKGKMQNKQGHKLKQTLQARTANKVPLMKMWKVICTEQQVDVQQSQKLILDGER